MLALPVGPRDHVRGPAGAVVTLVEYGDFECPACGQAFPVLRDIERRFAGRLRFVHRNFPLTSAHPHAQRAAETAEWAASQGAFWPMHDLLYAEQRDLSDSHLLELAERLGLSRASLAAAWQRHSLFPRVKEDFLSALSSGATGTPALFINTMRYDGALAAEALAQAINRAK